MSLVSNSVREGNFEQANTTDCTPIDSHGLVLEITDNADIPEAIRNLLHTGTEAVVVRNMVSSETARQLIRKLLDIEVMPILYQEVPELTVVDELVQKYWSEHGYDGYSLVEPKMLPGNLRSGAIGIHTDFGSRQINPIYGPLALSVCLKNSGIYQVQKPPRSFRGEDGTWDIKAWEAWKFLPAPTTLRTSFHQGEGDGVYFMNHPRQSYHAVANYTKQPPRIAAIFEHVLCKKQTKQ